MTPTERKDALVLARLTVEQSRAAGPHDYNRILLARLVLHMLDRANTRLVPAYAAMVEYGNAARNGTPDHVAWQRLRAAAIRAAEMEQADAGQNGAGHDEQ